MITIHFRDLGDAPEYKFRIMLLPGILVLGNNNWGVRTFEDEETFKTFIEKLIGHCVIECERPDIKDSLTQALSQHLRVSRKKVSAALYVRPIAFKRFR